MHKWMIATLSLVWSLGLATVAQAETVLEKVGRTGVLTVGTRLDLVPYSYFNDKQEWVGFSVDILNLVKAEVEKQVGRPVTIQVIEQKGFGDERITQLMNREIDIACESQFTWDRDRYVDFSTPYSISGIRLLSKKGSSLGSLESLVGKRVGVVENSIGSQLMKLAQPEAKVISFNSIDAIIQALQSGKIEAAAGDTIIMTGLLKQKGLTGYQITPNDPYARYGIACMIPENNSSFLRLVNYSIAKLMQGYVYSEKPYTDMVSQWFGPQGMIDDLDPNVIKTFFQLMIVTQEQLPLTTP